VLCVVQAPRPASLISRKSAPYSRLVLHLGRLWDYGCREEVQLKTWLARHLLARENTGAAHKVFVRAYIAMACTAHGGRLSVG
jgi:hypothetical protein